MDEGVEVNGDDEDGNDNEDGVVGHGNARNGNLTMQDVGDTCRRTFIPHKSGQYKSA